MANNGIRTNAHGELIYRKEIEVFRRNEANGFVETTFHRKSEAANHGRNDGLGPLLFTHHAVKLQSSVPTVITDGMDFPANLLVNNGNIIFQQPPADAAATHAPDPTSPVSPGVPVPVQDASPGSAPIQRPIADDSPHSVQEPASKDLPSANQEQRENHSPTSTNSTKDTFADAQTSSAEGLPTATLGDAANSQHLSASEQAVRKVLGSPFLHFLAPPSPSPSVEDPEIEALYQERKALERKEREEFPMVDWETSRDALREASAQLQRDLAAVAPLAGQYTPGPGPSADSDENPFLKPHPAFAPGGALADELPVVREVQAKVPAAATGSASQHHASIQDSIKHSKFRGTKRGADDTDGLGEGREKSKATFSHFEPDGSYRPHWKHPYLPPMVKKYAHLCDRNFGLNASGSAEPAHARDHV